MPPGASCAGLQAVASIAATLDLGSPRAPRGTEATPRSGPSTPRPCTRGPLTRDVERIGEPLSEIAWWLDQMGCNGLPLDACSWALAQPLEDYRRIVPRSSVERPNNFHDGCPPLTTLL
jgi:hypothetical protein